jgi:hypothetical protein
VAHLRLSKVGIFTSRQDGRVSMATPYPRPVLGILK